jgi:purine-nucleoside phosphorylase
MLNKITETANYIKAKVEIIPEIAIILGTGLGALVENIKKAQYIPYEEIPNFPISTVEGHKGNLIFGLLGNKQVMAMQGRFHYYEGYDITDVVLPVRLLGMLGVKNMILTNAAGGINPGFQPGILMMITDHISSFVPSPLRGANIEELGTRFPDMSHVYCMELQDVIRSAAVRAGIPLREGVYLQHPGPNFETPAEIRAYRSLGADAVGMSTACEAMALNHMGVKVCGISCITNLAAGMNQTALTHEEVFETANRVAEDFKRLVTEVVRGMH